MLKNRLLSHTARRTGRGGFTLVELLVVIGIIAILAGVALGPITRGIKQAKQSAGLQTARTIGLAEFSFSNDNNGSYPDVKNQGSGTGQQAAAVAQALLQGNYISDPSIFYISGSAATKFTGTTASTTIAQNNISWDFGGLANGNGLNTNTPDQVPVVWSSVAGGGTEPSIDATGVLTCTPVSSNAYGTAGVAVAFKSNSASFILAKGATPPLTVTLWDASYPGLTGATVLQGGG